MTHPYKWWYSSDGGEVYTGSFDTREEAVAYAKTSGGGLIAECQRQDFDLEVDPNDVLIQLEGLNSDIVGESEFLPNLTNEQVIDLGVMLTATMQEWVEKHGIDIKAWAFGDIRNQERVDP